MNIRETDHWRRGRAAELLAVEVLTEQGYHVSENAGDGADKHPDLTVEDQEGGIRLVEVKCKKEPSFTHRTATYVFGIERRLLNAYRERNKRLPVVILIFDRSTGQFYHRGLSALEAFERPPLDGHAGGTNVHYFGLVGFSVLADGLKKRYDTIYRSLK